MKDLDPVVFLAVFQEMLGWLFWPLVAFIVLGAVALAAILFRERGINARRLVYSELVGLGGGFAGVWLMLFITNSRLGDLGGPIDWLLAAAIWIAGAIGATMTAYVALTLLRGTVSRALVVSGPAATVGGRA